MARDLRKLYERIDEMFASISGELPYYIKDTLDEAMEGDRNFAEDYGEELDYSGTREEIQGAKEKIRNLKKQIRAANKLLDTMLVEIEDVIARYEPKVRKRRR